MKRDVVKDCVNVRLAKIGDEPLARGEIGKEQMEHVGRLNAVVRHERKRHSIGSCPVLQAGLIHLPDRSPTLLNEFSFFQLCSEMRRDQLRGQVARTEIDPAVLVDLTPEKARTIGSLLEVKFLVS